MKYLFALLVLVALSACNTDETLSGYGAAGKVWTLRQLDKTLISERVTLTFPEAGRLAGQAPCNSYSGAQTAPYPWFKADRIAATRRACPALALEADFFKALEAMTLAEVSGNTMILSNEAGREMIFTAE